MIYRKLTICIHFGKKDNYPFLENLLKSFLVCNLYPNIEIIIAETGGDKEIRNWLKKIDFNNLQQFRNIFSRKICCYSCFCLKYPKLRVNEETTIQT